MIIAISGVNFTLGYLVRIYRVVLRSHVRYDVLSAASLSKTILTCSLILYFLTRGYGLVTLAIIHAIGEILEHIAIYWIARKIHPGLGFSIHLFDRNRIRNMLRYSLSAFLVQFGWSLRERVDPLVIGGILGSRWVPEYSIGARFYSLFRDLTNAMFGGHFFSAYSQIEGAGERSVLANYFLKSMRFSTMLAIFGATSLIFCGDEFIARWLGAGFSRSYTVVCVLALPFTLYLMQYPVGNLMFALDKQHYLAVTALTGGIVNLVLSLLLVLSIGFFGVVWATFIEMTTVYALIFPYLLCKTAEIPFRVYRFLDVFSGTLRRGC